MGPTIKPRRRWDSDSTWASWLNPPAWQGQTAPYSLLGQGFLRACMPGSGDLEPFLVWKSNVTGTVQVAITMASADGFQVHFLKNDDVLDGVAPTGSYSFSQALSVVPGDSLTVHLGAWGNYPTVETAFTVTLMPAALEGDVSLGGYLGDNATVGVKFELAPVGGGTVVSRYTLLNAGGGFRLDNITPGAYNVSVKSEGSLRAELDNVSILSDPTVLENPIVLQMGDINGDNSVSFEDFSILQNSYGRSGVNPVSAAALASGGCGALGVMLMALMGLAVYGYMR